MIIRYGFQFNLFFAGECSMLLVSVKLVLAIVSRQQQDTLLYLKVYSSIIRFVSVSVDYSLYIRIRLRRIWF